jgi:hypothetical protein
LQYPGRYSYTDRERERRGKAKKKKRRRRKGINSIYLHEPISYV